MAVYMAGNHKTLLQKKNKKNQKKPQICIHIKINLRHYFVIVMITSTPGLYVSKNPAEVSHDLGTGDFLYV